MSEESKHTSPAKPSTRIYSWQKHQWQKFLTARAADHLPHALLLTGSDGIGKNDFAELLANSLLCEQVDGEGYACGECKGCKVKKSNAHPDFKRVGLPEGKQQIPVNAIRELTGFLTLTRSYGGYRVVVVNAADKMNINAANSLLKSLEEPPSKTVIILVADQYTKLPVTIRSRCQMISMNKPDEDMAIKWLEHQGLEHDAKMMLSLADNKPLLAKQLDANKTLLDARTQFAKDLIAILQNSQSITEVAKNWEKTDLNILLNWQLKWLHAVAKILLVQKDDNLATNKFLAQIIANTQNPESIWKLYTDLLHLKSMTDYPLNRLMFTESMLLLWRDVGRPQ